MKALCCPGRALLNTEGNPIPNSHPSLIAASNACWMKPFGAPAIASTFAVWDAIFSCCPVAGSPESGPLIKAGAKFGRGSIVLEN